MLCFEVGRHIQTFYILICFDIVWHIFDKMKFAKWLLKKGKIWHIWTYSRSSSKFAFLQTFSNFRHLPSSDASVQSGSPSPAQSPLIHLPEQFSLSSYLQMPPIHWNWSLPHVVSNRKKERKKHSWTVRWQKLSVKTPHIVILAKSEIG